uniref:Uncharacterized protein n=1 Tax=Neobodo designis TaxID=312471 RepID=A0A7S1QPE5_NEODS|mmetsp:Transcript_49648/g.153342  ORF Transcript_49648/g.153342 Transcript_49648/m.153342 type:complete len:201 (+) Transcript_49648:31-633(+)
MRRSSDDADEIAALNELVAEQRRTIRALLAQRAQDDRSDEKNQELTAKLSAARNEATAAAAAEADAHERARHAEAIADEARVLALQRETQARAEIEALHEQVLQLQVALAASEERVRITESEHVALLQQIKVSREAVIESQKALLQQRANEVEALRSCVDEQRTALASMESGATKCAPVGSAREAVQNSPRRQRIDRERM